MRRPPPPFSTHQHNTQELKAQKEASKRLGKKKKDEAAAADAALAAKHEAELKSLEVEEGESRSQGGSASAAAKAAAATDASADSLSRFKLDDGDDKKEEKELPNLRKGSKAARKRAERLAADAERERARDEERAALAGTGAGSLEARELEETALRPLGLAVFDVPADGHCLYAALAHQLAQAKAKEEREGGGAKEGGGGGGGDDGGGDNGGCGFDFTVASLRALAARHIREHAPDFEPFIADDEELLAEEGGEQQKKTGEEVEKEEKEEEEGEGNLSKVERYCRRLEGTATWGGQPELQALASALPATIKVLSAGMEPVVVEDAKKRKGPVRPPPLSFPFSSDFSISFPFGFVRSLCDLVSLKKAKKNTKKIRKHKMKKKQELTICYLRHAFGLGEHYNSTTVAAAAKEEKEGGGGESEGESGESDNEG